MSQLKLKLGRKGQAAGIIGILAIVLVGLTIAYSTIDTTLYTATHVFHEANETAHDPHDYNVSKTQSLTGDASQSGDSFTVIVSTLQVYNDSDCSTGVFTYGTHYTILGNGTSNVRINMTDAATSTNNTCIRYDWRDASYVQDSNARLIVGFLPMIVAVVLVAAIVAFI